MPVPTRYSEELAPWFLTAYVREAWNRLGLSGPEGRPQRIAVYGAGRHSAWLERVTRHVPHRPDVVALLDDRPDPRVALWNRQAFRPEELDPGLIEAVLISTDTRAAELKRRCLALFGGAIDLIDLYDGFPEGPYPKKPAYVTEHARCFGGRVDTLDAAVRGAVAALGTPDRLFVAGIHRSGKTLLASACARALHLPLLSFDERFPWAASEPARAGEVLDALGRCNRFALDSIPRDADGVRLLNEWLAAHPSTVLCVYCPDEDEWFRRILSTWYFSDVMRLADEHRRQARELYGSIIPALAGARRLFYDSCENAFTSHDAHLERMRRILTP